MYGVHYAIRRAFTSRRRRKPESKYHSAGIYLGRCVATLRMTIVLTLLALWWLTMRVITVSHRIARQQRRSHR